MCNRKFMFLQTAIPDLNNYYLNKKLMDSLIPSNQSCHYDYGVFNEDKSDYDFNWQIINNSTRSTKFVATTANPFTTENMTTDSTRVITTAHYNTNTFKSKLTANITEYTNKNLSSCFRYTKSKYLKDNSFSGKYGSYLSGGYVYRLESDLETTLNDLSYLQKMNWIDKSTRAVFIEFTLYNPNINLFCSIVLLFELLPSGNIIPIISFNTMNLWTTSREVMVTGCMAAYLIVVLVLMAREIKTIKRMKKAYFKQFWPYIDWSLFILTWTALPMYLYKIYALHNVLDFISMNSIKYMNLSSLTGWNELLGMILALCSFLVTIKLIKLLRFNKKISYLTLTIKNSSKDLVSFMIVFFILYSAYVQLMYIFFNEKTLGYATFTKSMVTNFLIIMGKFDLSPMLESNYTASAIIFSTYNILIVMIMVNFLITIVSDNFANSRKEAAKTSDSHSVFTHIFNRIKPKLIIKELKFKKIQESAEPIYVNANNIYAFESSTRKLIDALKGRIQSTEFSEI